MASDQEGLVKIGVILIFSGAGLFWHGLRHFRRTRRTQDTATSKISSAPQGFVEIQGYAWPLESGPGQSFPTNSEKRSVVYKSITFQKYVRRNKSSYWQDIYTFEIKEPFYILDETGIALVSPENMDFEAAQKVTAWKSLSEDQRSTLLRQNNNPDLPVKLTMFSGSYRVVEKFIYIGAPIFVHGTFTSARLERASLQNPAIGLFQKEVIRLAREPGRKKALFDRTGDGQICEDEARVGFFMTASQVLKKQATDVAPVQFYGEIQSHGEHPSFIADCHQEHLMKRLSGWLGLRLVGGVVLIVAGVLAFGYMFTGQIY